ncbi:protein SLX4IP [Lampris incognitus]|uniref:protein SLX4IP n=1 Tax=Lampris incognitus TaxID=2546036 RepID=UPI0024B56F2D|nr:protein SLX4IP [Lampris incognitus]
MTQRLRNLLCSPLHSFPRHSQLTSQRHKHTVCFRADVGCIVAARQTFRIIAFVNPVIARVLGSGTADKTTKHFRSEGERGATECGNFAVLVDLHVVPLGSREDPSWFTTQHIKEVTTAVRDDVDHRVKQYTVFARSRNQPKQRRELGPAATLCVKGESFNLVAGFQKRHVNLRCVAKQQHYAALRVFPERYVVCVSSPEDASVHHGNPSSAVTELSEQSRSEYFSRVGETQEPLNSPTKTKRTLLQKIARCAGIQRGLNAAGVGEQQLDQSVRPEDQEQEIKPEESKSSPVEVGSNPGDPTVSPGEKAPSPEAARQPIIEAFPTLLDELSPQVEGRGPQNLKPGQQTENGPPDSVDHEGVSLVSSQLEPSQESSGSKRRKPGDTGEDPQPQRAKRTCLGEPPVLLARELMMQTPSIERASQTSQFDPLPPPPLPPVVAKAEAESKAFPVSKCKKTTLEVELLTPGKRAQRLPLTSNNTEQTNQNRLATSLRGLSVKPASSGSSISSRSTVGEEGSQNVPRTSRLRRQKRS